MVLIHSDTFFPLALAAFSTRFSSSGLNRTGTMCALYRLEVDGWTADEVLQEMQSFGYHDIYQ